MPAVRAFALALLLLAPGLASAAHEGGVGPGFHLRDPVVVRAAAVAQTDNGLVGSIATVTMTLADNGTGHVFMDTIPLTQVDMQGSARLAVQVAAGVTGIDVRKHDFFFVVRSGSQIIGGPSAGAILTVGVIAALKGWAVDPGVMMTGTINPDGAVGPVGGVPEKAAAAARAGATTFLYPEGQGTMPDGGSLGEYCERRLGIRCAPVVDVEEAVLAVTGHEFERRPVEGEVTDENFKRVLAPFSADLVTNAFFGVLVACAAYEAALPDLPSGVPQVLNASLVSGEESLAEAYEAVADGKHYAAASKSFMASIRGRYVRDVVGFFTAEDPQAHVAGLLDKMDAEVAAAASETRAATATSLTMLQAVGAAQSRATEAENRAALARERAEAAESAQDVLEAYDAAAFAVERARTAPWWLRIGHAFEEGAGGGDAPADLAGTARDMIENAQQAITYAEVILEEVGLGKEVAEGPSNLLAAARRDYNAGYFAASLFEAIEAEVRANMILEVLYTRDEFPRARVAVAAERAERAILESRDAGVEPLLAMSYYEFAGTITNPVEAVTFYNLARTIGKAGRFLAEGPVEPTPSRFVGQLDNGWWTYRMPVSWAAGFFAIGLALGLGGGAAAFFNGRRDEAADVAPRSLTPDAPHPADASREEPPSPPVR